MRMVLVSSCLLGEPVRYDGRGCACAHPVLARWIAEGRVVGFCPEISGGLPVPRPPAELIDGSRVADILGRDLTAEFSSGARQALALVRAKGITVAVLKEGSPSCGSGTICDGSFSGRRIPGAGLTTACLSAAGIWVFNEAQFDQAAERLEC